MTKDKNCDPIDTDVLSPRVPLVVFGFIGLFVAAVALLKLLEKSVVERSHPEE